ncbi:SufD family Fe-S cluster assembly protein, partial [Candidatus Gottesmanbacteria bacterium]|nr:SufD family Fe-S cluster assembly protein [Candidatus Gottesmanbacteria bacterium]
MQHTYKYGFHKPENYVFKSKKGLDQEVVENISARKHEPQWMQRFRLQALSQYYHKSLPTWGGDLTGIDFDNIYYYISPTDKKASRWEDLPDEIRDTYDRIGIPEAEKKFLSGVSAQYECITGDALVFGETGATRLQDIEPQMYIYALNELTKKLEKQKVLGVSVKGKRPIYEVKVAGRIIRCTQNHPLLTLRFERPLDRKRGRFSTQWEYLRNLHVGDYVGIVKNFPEGGKSYSLPPPLLNKTYIGRNQYGSYQVCADWLYQRTQKTLRIPSKTSENLLWLIGLYMGDGYISRTSRKLGTQVLSLAIPQTEPGLRKKVSHVVRDVFGYKVSKDSDPYRMRIFSSPIMYLFKMLLLEGSARTKKLPLWVFGLPKSQRLAFIGGYIDSDGYLRNGKKNCDAWITSVNRQLLESVHMLAISCGLHATGIHEFTFFPDVFDNKRKSIGYRLQITGDLLPLTTYSWKVQNGFTPRNYYHTYGSHHGSPIDSHISDEIGFGVVQKITPVGEEPVYDIEVEGHHNFIANGIVVHNSEVVYKSIQETLRKKGVVFLDMDSGLREYPEIVKQYFGTIIPPGDNKFAALNSSVWSGGSFVYVPKGVKVDLPLQAYFRINAANMGQFERTLIIAEEGSFVHYVEGCTAPIYTTDSLHSAVVEIIVKKGARVRYTTIQNWSNNVYNLVTKRARVEEEGVMEWVDGNIGSRLSMKYPS